jgi:hypothetical protein
MVVVRPVHGFGRGGVERPEHRTHTGSHRHPPRRRRTRQGSTESNTAAADPGVRPRTSARPTSRRGLSRRRASHFRASPLQHSRRQRNHPGRLDPNTAPRTLPQRHRCVGLSRHPDRIERTRMGIHLSLKLYPHVQKRLRHVATRVAPPSQHLAIRAHGRGHQSVVLIVCTTLCRARTVG